MRIWVLVLASRSEAMVSQVRQCKDLKKKGEKQEGDNASSKGPNTGKCATNE